MLNIFKKRSSRASKASNLTIKSEQSSHLDFDVLFEMMKKLQEKTQYLLTRPQTKKNMFKVIFKAMILSLKNMKNILELYIIYNIYVDFSLEK